jgi:hypothetical protein
LARICVFAFILVENWLLSQVKVVVAPLIINLGEVFIDKGFEHKASGSLIVVFLYILDWKSNAEVEELVFTRKDIIDVSISIIIGINLTVIFCFLLMSESTKSLCIFITVFITHGVIIILPKCCSLWNKCLIFLGNSGNWEF